MLHMPVCELRGAQSEAGDDDAPGDQGMGIAAVVIFGSVGLEILFMRWARNWVGVVAPGGAGRYTALEILTVVVDRQRNKAFISAADII